MHFSNKVIHKLGPFHPFNKLLNMAVSNMIHFIVHTLFYPESKVGDTSSFFSNPLIGDGILGYRESKQEMAAMYAVTPATRSAS